MFVSTSFATASTSLDLNNFRPLPSVTRKMSLLPTVPRMTVKEHWWESWLPCKTLQRAYEKRRPKLIVPEFEIFFLNMCITWSASATASFPELPWILAISQEMVPNLPPISRTEAFGWITSWAILYSASSSLQLYGSPENNHLSNSRYLRK